MNTNSMAIAFLSGAALMRNPLLRGEAPLDIFLSGVSGVNFGALVVSMILAASTNPVLARNQETEGSRGYPRTLAVFSFAGFLTSVIMLYFDVK